MAFVDFIRSLVKPGEQTAQAYFNARRMDGIHLCQYLRIYSAFIMQYDVMEPESHRRPVACTPHLGILYYTRDKKFLKEIGYDLIKSSAQFAVDHLWHKPDGTYTAAPSTSPEHGPIDEGVTFAHAVVREILLDAIQASKELGIDSKERKTMGKDTG